MISTRLDAFTASGGRNSNEDSYGTYDSGVSALSYIVFSDGRSESVRLEDDGTTDSNEIFAAVVADGLGGHEGGEVASRWAVREFLGSLVLGIRNGTDAVEAIRRSYGSARAAVIAHAPKDSATTLTTAVVDRGKLYLGNVGDSRSYVIDTGKLILRTKDHSFVQSLVDSGAIDEKEARSHPRKNILTRALGSEPNEPDIYCVGDAWDTVLLCSDGACGVMSDDEIMRLVVVDGKAKTIVDMSLAKGSQDNSTAILMYRV